MITIFYIYLIGLLLSPFIFALLNYKIKWVTKKSLGYEPGDMFLVLVCLLFWPISSSIAFSVMFITHFVPKD